MTTVLAKLTRTGGGFLYLDAVAPGPSGGMYVVGNDNAGDVVTARLNSDGSLNWAKDITIPSLTPIVCAAASSSNRLVIAATNGFGAYTCVLMLDDTGSLVWESVLANFLVTPTEGLLIGSDNSVYLCGSYDGPLSGVPDDALLKLNPTTGAITWQVGISETGTTSSPSTRFSSMRQLSGGDLVMAMWGPGATAGAHGHVQRLSSSDGSVVWTRKIDWGMTGGYASNIWVGTDASDNIYCCGSGFDFGIDGAEYPLAKLASDGSTSWVRNVRRVSGTYTPVFEPCWGSLTADASGVQIAGNMNSGKVGHLLVDAAGTLGTANVPLTQYTPFNWTSNAARAGQSGSASVMFGFADTTDYSDYYFYAGISPTGSGDDGTYGTVARATISFNLIAGTATVSTPGSWTRPSAPSLSLASDLGASVGTGTLSSSVVPPAVTCAATSLGPTTQFGPDPFIRGYTTSVAPGVQFGTIKISRSFPDVGISSPSTTFGTAVSTRQQRATALGPTANFGTPAYEPNTTRAADSLGIVLAGIGTPFATLGIAPEPSHRASSTGPTAHIGTPTANNVLTVQASGSLFTQFGTAAAKLTQVASGLEPGAQFGTAKVTMSRAASGFRATQLGTPVVGLYGLPAGFLRTQFGTPSTLAPITCEATGFLVTNIGSGAAGGAWNLRTRSAYFRTRFGTPQAERTAP